MLAAIRSFFFNLHGLHRFGSFLNPLSAKNSCSPALKINSSRQSMHRRTLSVYSCIGSPPLLDSRLSCARSNRSFSLSCVYGGEFTGANLSSFEERNDLILRFAAILLSSGVAYYYCRLRVQPNGMLAIIALFRWVSSKLSQDRGSG